MQISTVNKSKINLGDRIDAEYFEPSYLENENRLKKLNVKPLSDYCKLVSSAFYPSATEYYSIGEIPFIRCVDSISYSAITQLQEDAFEKLPFSFIEENKSIHKLKDGDVVITKVGTPCYASIIHGIEEVALSRTVLGLCKITKIDPYYLTIYLRSKYGFEQLYRERELTIQYQLTLERVGRVLIYKPSNSFEQQVRRIFIESQRLFKKFTGNYQQAEQILLSELKLLNWKPKHQLSFVKNFSDTKAANRIDAEYYQPMYEKIVKAINLSKDSNNLGNLVTIKKCVEPGSSVYQESGIPFLRVSNLSKFGYKEGNQQYLSQETYQEFIKHQPKQGEILLSKDATPGIAYYLNESPKEMIPSSGILRLTINDRKKLYPEYLTLVLNSVIVQKQIERDAGGSIINHWLVDQVKSTLIPIISLENQKKITNLIDDSFNKRKLSKQLLGIAKQSVEMAIEEDESQAKKWIASQFKKLEKIDDILK